MGFVCRIINTITAGVLNSRDPSHQQPVQGQNMPRIYHWQHQKGWYMSAHHQRNVPISILILSLYTATPDNKDVLEHANTSSVIIFSRPLFYGHIIDIEVIRRLTRLHKANHKNTPKLYWMYSLQLVRWVLKRGVNLGHFEVTTNMCTAWCQMINGYLHLSWARRMSFPA